jgi:hypothetical protein
MQETEYSVADEVEKVMLQAIHSTTHKAIVALRTSIN